MSLTLENIQAIRANNTARSDFLESLLKRHEKQILGIVRRAGGPEYLNLLDEGHQAFLLAANRALDTARVEDDGRGNNDPEAWCAWRGIFAVREVMRDKRGRKDRPSIRQHAEARMIYTGGFSDIVSDSNESMSYYYADPNDYAAEAVTNVDFTRFLGKLKGIDREVAMLLAYGEADGKILVCNCTGDKHSYIRDIAQLINCTEERVFKIIRRIRDAAALEFEVA